MFPVSDKSRKLKKVLKAKEMEVGGKLYPSCDGQNDRRPTSVEGFEELWSFGR
jgi:hypothetical protein